METPTYTSLKALAATGGSKITPVAAGGTVPCIKTYIGSYYQGFLVTRCNCTSCFNLPSK